MWGILLLLFLAGLPAASSSSSPIWSCSSKKYVQCDPKRHGSCLEHDVVTGPCEMYDIEIVGAVCMDFASETVIDDSVCIDAGEKYPRGQKHCSKGDCNWRCRDQRRLHTFEDGNTWISCDDIENTIACKDDSRRCGDSCNEAIREVRCFDRDNLLNDDLPCVSNGYYPTKPKESFLMADQEVTSPKTRCFDFVPHPGNGIATAGTGSLVFKPLDNSFTQLPTFSPYYDLLYDFFFTFHSADFKEDYKFPNHISARAGIMPMETGEVSSWSDDVSTTGHISLAALQLGDPFSFDGQFLRAFPPTKVTYAIELPEHRGNKISPRVEPNYISHGIVPGVSSTPLARYVPIKAQGEGSTLGALAFAVRDIDLKQTPETVNMTDIGTATLMLPEGWTGNTKTKCRLARCEGDLWLYKSNDLKFVQGTVTVNERRIDVSLPTSGDGFTGDQSTVYMYCNNILAPISVEEKLPVTAFFAPNRNSQYYVSFSSSVENIPTQGATTPRIAFYSRTLRYASASSTLDADFFFPNRGAVVVQTKSTLTEWALEYTIDNAYELLFLSSNALSELAKTTEDKTVVNFATDSIGQFACSFNSSGIVRHAECGTYCGEVVGHVCVDTNFKPSDYGCLLLPSFTPPDSYDCGEPPSISIDALATRFDGAAITVTGSSANVPAADSFVFELEKFSNVYSTDSVGVKQNCSTMASVQQSGRFCKIDDTRIGLLVKGYDLLEKNTVIAEATTYNKWSFGDSFKVNVFHISDLQTALASKTLKVNVGTVEMPVFENKCQYSPLKESNNRFVGSLAVWAYRRASDETGLKRVNRVEFNLPSGYTLPSVDHNGRVQARLAVTHRDNTIWSLTKSLVHVTALSLLDGARVSVNLPDSVDIDDEDFMIAVVLDNVAASAKSVGCSSRMVFFEDSATPNAGVFDRRTSSTVLDPSAMAIVEPGTFVRFDIIYDAKTKNPLTPEEIIDNMGLNPDTRLVVLGQKGKNRVQFEVTGDKAFFDSSHQAFERFFASHFLNALKEEGYYFRIGFSGLRPPGKYECIQAGCMKDATIANDCGFYSKSLFVCRKGADSDYCSFSVLPSKSTGCKPSISTLTSTVTGPLIRYYIAPNNIVNFMNMDAIEVRHTFSEGVLLLNENKQLFSCATDKGTPIRCYVDNDHTLHFFVPHNSIGQGARIEFYGISKVEEMMTTLDAFGPSGSSLRPKSAVKEVTFRSTYLSPISFPHMSQKIYRVGPNVGGGDPETDGVLSVTLRTDSILDVDASFDGVEIAFEGHAPDGMKCTVAVLSPLAAKENVPFFLQSRTILMQGAPKINASQTSSPLSKVVSLVHADATPRSGSDRAISFKYASEISVDCFGFKVEPEVFVTADFSLTFFSVDKSVSMRTPPSTQVFQIDYDESKLEVIDSGDHVFSFTSSSYPRNNIIVETWYKSYMQHFFTAPLAINSVVTNATTSNINVFVPAQMHGFSSLLNMNLATTLEKFKYGLDSLAGISNPGEGSAKRTPIGEWACEDSEAERGFSECYVPGNCGTKYQGQLVCTLGDELQDTTNACSFTRVRLDEVADIRGCIPDTINDPVISHTEKGSLLITFSIDPRPFEVLKKPEFKLFVPKLPEVVVGIEGCAKESNVECRAYPTNDPNIIEVRIFSFAGGSAVIIFNGHDHTILERGTLEATHSVKGVDAVFSSTTFKVKNIGFFSRKVRPTPGASLVTGPKSPVIDGFSLIRTENHLSIDGKLVSFIIGTDAPGVISTCTLSEHADHGFISLAAPLHVGLVTAGAVACPIDVDDESGKCETNVFTVTFSETIQVSGWAFACTFVPSKNAEPDQFTPRSYSVAMRYEKRIVRAEMETPLTFDETHQTAGFATQNGNAYFRFSATSSDAITVDANLLATKLNAIHVAVEPSGESSADVFAIVDGFFATNVPALTNTPGLYGLIPFLEGTNAIVGNDVSIDRSSITFGVAGAQLCGPFEDAPVFRKCEVRNNCGVETSAPHVCVGAQLGTDELVILDSDETCGPQDDFIPETRGCGAVMCTSPKGEFVACDHPSICIAGCEETSHTLTSEEISERNATLATVCVKGGVVVDADLCPEEYIGKPVFAKQCMPVSECQLLCTNADGNAAACASSAAWSTCSTSCGSGLQTRNLACSPSRVSIGEHVDAVSDDLCKYAPFAYDLERPCTGTTCADFDWRCSPNSEKSGDGTDISLDDFGPCDELSWGECSTDCGSGTRSRVVSCGAFNEDANLVSVGLNEQLCRPKGTKPSTSEKCIEDTCADAEWRCYAVGGNPTESVGCESTGGFTCPKEFCGKATGEREVACYNDLDILPSERCTNSTKPERSVECPLVKTNCAPNAEVHTACNLNSKGEIDKDLGDITCIDESESNVPRPHRRLPCIDRASGDVVDDDWCGGDTVLLRQCALPTCNPNTTTTWRSTAGECVDINISCATYRIDTVECVAVTEGSEDVVVEDFACPASERPDRVVECDESDGIIECVNGGTCATTPVVYQGMPYPDIFIGSCACPVGMGGVDCSISVEIDSVSVDVGSSDYIITWTVSTPDVVSSATITLSSDDIPIPATLGVVPIQSLSLSVPVAKIARLFEPGNYTLAVTSGNSTAVTTLNHRGLCFVSSHACLNDGQCSDATGSCECSGEFSGPRCQVSPCDNKGCNIATSQCETDAGGIATCECVKDDDDEPLFEGDLCNDPVGGCEDELPPCENGGVRAGYIVNNTAACGACSCKDSWTGDLCGNCGLDSICANGHADDDCETCVCERGFQGDSCKCRAVHVTMTFKHDGGIDWYPGGSSALAVWFGNVISAIKHILNNKSLAVTAFAHTQVDTETGLTYVQVTVLVGPTCDDADETFIPLSEADAEMFTTYSSLDSLRNAFESGDAAEVDGLKEVHLDAGLGLEDPNCSGSSCPTNLGNGGVVDPDDAPQKKGGSGLSNGALIGIIVGAAAAAVLIIVLLLACCCGWCCFNKAARTVETEVQMGSTGTSQV